MSLPGIHGNSHLNSFVVEGFGGMTGAAAGGVDVLLVLDLVLEVVLVDSVVVEIFFESAAASLDALSLAAYSAALLLASASF